MEHLADWQKIKLAADISKYTRQGILILAAVGEETQCYAADFKGVFARVQWDVDGPKDARIDQAALDVQLSINEDFFSHTELIPRQYFALRSALANIGIKSRSGFVFDLLSLRIKSLSGLALAHGSLQARIRASA